MSDKRKELEREIFVCRQCGHCCHGNTTVSLDDNDFERMAKHLKMSQEQLKLKYLIETDGVIQMKTVDGHCVFYNEGCTIHLGKPWRCSQWPLHPSILDDKSNFSAISDSCPGIRSSLDYQEFCEKFTELLKFDES